MAQRFDRSPFPRSRPNSPPSGRRLAAAKRHIERERAKWGPLLADWAAAHVVTETPEERIARIDAGVRSGFAQLRQHEARMWREGRAALRCLPHSDRQAMLAEWNAKRWCPRRPEYFVDWLRRTLLRRLVAALAAMATDRRLAQIDRQ